MIWVPPGPNHKGYWTSKMVNVDNNGKIKGFKTFTHDPNDEKFDIVHKFTLPISNSYKMTRDEAKNNAHKITDKYIYAPKDKKQEFMDEMVANGIKWSNISSKTGQRMRWEQEYMFACMALTKYIRCGGTCVEVHSKQGSVTSVSSMSSATKSSSKNTPERSQQAISKKPITSSF